MLKLLALRVLRVCFEFAKFRGYHWAIGCQKLQKVRKNFGKTGQDLA